jgi:hypothetical protein
MLKEPQQRRTLVLGKLKVHRVDMRSRSRRRYTIGFLERIVARVFVTTLLQRGYTVRDNVRECADEA